MFSPEFMKFLINYQKDEFTPEPTKNEVYFKNGRRGTKKAAKVVVTVSAK